MLRVVPAAIAEVDAAHECDLLVDGHQLLVVRPHQDALAWDVVGVTQDLQDKRETLVNSLYKLTMIIIIIEKQR